ncbi:MAG: transglutaminase domain-containing protein [Actinomycetota bacterium]|nr:transglutaminase domain-containing protein [Actinomycetota bacterium]
MPVDEEVIEQEAAEQQAPAEAPAAAPEQTQTTAAQLRMIDEELPLSLGRPAVAALFMGLGTAFLAGGMFTGFLPRIFAAFGAIVGVGLAVWALRPHKRPTIIQILSVLLLFLVGMLALSTTGFGAMSKMSQLVGTAIKNAKLRRPPAFFEDGWRALLVWAMAALTYGGTYIGIVKRRPALGLMLPLPVVAFCAIAQPPEAQLVGGIVALLGFVIGLAVLHRADNGDEGGMPLGFELRRAARAAPIVIALVVGLAFLGQAGFLFPKPLYDPTQRAILPKAVPLSKTVDRVLFTVRSTVTGPWRTGILDVYDGQAWRLPPFSASSLVAVDRSGALSNGTANASAQFHLEGLEGTVLPTPPRSVAFQATNAPALLTDGRTGTVRVEVGQVKKGFDYSISFTVLPKESDLIGQPPAGPDMAEFLEAPTAPPRVRQLIDSGPKDLWKRLDFLRKKMLDTVAATGSGLPVAVPPNKVDDIYFGSKQATPFEIVAAEALVSRWAGVPARIGYGFDGGDRKGADLLEVRPKHGSLWLEVWFPRQGWLPITGMPKHAKTSLNSQEQQVHVAIIPSDDIAVNLYLPMKVTPAGVLAHRIVAILLLILPFILLGLLIRFTYPGFVKWRRRARKRAWAMREGPQARIAVAYADFRDLATDLGLGDPYATPLAFLEQVVTDDEHAELAWLVTRTLWGDLIPTLGDDEVFAAEELSRSLRRRLFEAQPITIRAISVVSRLSLRNPFAPEILAPKAQRHLPLKRKQEETHALV